jgi:hypothetical protein
VYITLQKQFWQNIGYVRTGQFIDCDISIFDDSSGVETPCAGVVLVLEKGNVAQDEGDGVEHVGSNGLWYVEPGGQGRKKGST